MLRFLPTATWDAWNAVAGVGFEIESRAIPDEWGCYDTFECPRPGARWCGDLLSYCIVRPWPKEMYMCLDVACPRLFEVYLEIQYMRTFFEAASSGAHLSVALAVWLTVLRKL